MDRSAADIQDVAVEEGLEPPLPTDPGWHLLEEKRGVHSMYLSFEVKEEEPAGKKFLSVDVLPTFL